jgi:hypothetical protein
MALKQEHALLIGLAAAGAVLGIFQISMPPVAGARASAANNTHLDATRKWATVTSVSLVTLIGLLTQDPAVFVIGGSTAIALDFSHRVANATDHQSGKLPSSSQAAGTSSGQPAAGGGS